MAEKDRFAFGENWKSFLAALSEERICRATVSLSDRLSARSLEGKRFLDIGSGSGLFSLAAHRLGAEVTSMDYDQQSVECTRELRERFADPSRHWEIRRGSVLDESLMQSMGQFDVVYCWGVLHHTGDLWRALQLAAGPTRVGGQLFIAIYNDQGRASRRWLAIKRTYNSLPRGFRPLWVTCVAGVYESKFALARAWRRKNPLPFADWRAKKQDRGMSAWHDWVDWVGGLPFEVATPDRIIDRLDSAGFRLETLHTVGKGWGCNEYVFRRDP